MTTGQVIEQFVTKAIQSGGWMEMDRLYLQNRLLQMVGLKEIVLEQTTQSLSTVDMVNHLIDVARQNTIITHQKQEEMLRGQLYDLLTPPPSVLNALFAQQYNDDPNRALDYFHRLSLQNQMILHEEKVTPFETNQGSLWISETEEETYHQYYYPSCDLCFENEGNGLHYAMYTALRYIRMNLQGSSFGFRYYQTPVWKNHCLFVAQEHHQKMIQRQTVDQLLQIVDIFDSYFVTCDLDLHSKYDHVVYEGGTGTLPVFERESKAQFIFDAYPQVDIELLNYPLTTCRLTSTNKEALMSLVASMIPAWRRYQDDGLCAFSEEGTMQHSVALAVRKVKENYEVYISFAELTKEAVSLYERMGVTVSEHSERVTADQLAEKLILADPFEGNHQKMDRWMKKINELGEG